MDYDSNTKSYYSSYPIIMQASITSVNQVTTALQATTFHSLANYTEGLSQTISNTTPTMLYSSQSNASHLTLKLPSLPSIENIRTDIEYCLYVSTSGIFNLRLVFLDSSLASVASTDTMVYDPDNQLNQPSIASLNGIKIKADLLNLPKTAQYVLAEITMSSGSSATFKYDYAKAISYHTVDLETDFTFKSIASTYLDLQFYNNKGDGGGDISNLTAKVNKNEADIVDLDTSVSNLTTKTNTNESDIDDLDTSVSNLTTKTNTNETDITALQNGKLDKIGGNLTGDLTTDSKIEINGLNGTSGFVHKSETVELQTYINASYGAYILTASNDDILITTNNRSYDQTNAIFKKDKTTSFSGNKITDVALCTSDTDCANKKYVDDAISGSSGGSYLPLSGGTVTGNVSVDGVLVAGGDYFRVGTSSLGMTIKDEFKGGGSNAISFKSNRPSTGFYFGETQIVALNTSESVFSSKLKVEDEIDADNNKIVNVATPTESTDACNKAYCDNVVSSSVYNIVWAMVTNSINVETESGSTVWNNIVSGIDGALNQPMISLGSSIQAASIGIAISSKTSTPCTFKLQLSKTNLTADMVDVTDWITVPEAEVGLFVRHKFITNNFFDGAQFMGIILDDDSGGGILTELVVYGL